jgi:hypothetical protein
MRPLRVLVFGLRVIVVVGIVWIVWLTWGRIREVFILVFGIISSWLSRSRQGVYISIVGLESGCTRNTGSPGMSGGVIWRVFIIRARFSLIGTIDERGCFYVISADAVFVVLIVMGTWYRTANR